MRNTYVQLRDTTQRTFFDWLPPKQFGKHKVADHEYKITAFDNTEIEILFRALDRPDMVGNLLSLELTGAWLNECREIPQEIFEALQGRVGRFPSKRDVGATWSGIIMDTNPPETDSWLYKLAEETKPDNFAMFKQPSGLSPEAENKKYLPDHYYENLAMGKDPEFVKVYVHGQYGFIIDGKPVFPEYKDHIHCKPIEPLKGVPIRRGWDFGLTPAVSFSQMSPSGQWLILDEFVADNVGVDRFSDSLLRYCAKNYPGFVFQDIGDPAGDQRAQTDEKTCFQILRAKNIQIEPGEQDPYIRIESVKKPLNTMIEGEPGLLLDPKAKTLRKAFRGGYRYRRMQTAAKQFTEKPEKNEYSHVCFTGDTRVSTPGALVRIDSLKVGDLVNTPMGARRVTAISEKEADTVLMAFSDGREITCTPDHPFFSDNGIVRADALKYALTEQDEVSASWVDRQNMKYSISRVLRTIVSLRGTTNPIITSTVAVTYIGWYGKRITARFLKGIVSTTKTMIGRITESKILNVSTFPIMRPIMQSTELSLANRGFCEESRQHGKPQKSGTDRKRAGNGILNTASGLGKIVKSRLTSAFSAANATKLSVEQESAGTAQTSVNPRRVEIPASMTLQDNAPSAANPFWSTATQKQKRVQGSALKVCEVSPWGVNKVYDITVEDAHCFYAEGVLVHNCDALQYDATRLFGMILKTPKQQKQERRRSYNPLSWMAA